MPKARVLPDPVLALPQTSRPARASATVMAWMEKAVVMPWEASALTRAGSTPRESKVGASSSGRTRSSSVSEARPSRSAVVVMGSGSLSRLVTADGRPSAPV